MLVLSLAVGGCHTRYEVESNTSWHGWVEDHSVNGRGPAVYDARQGGYATFTKSTVDGYLRARVTGFWGDERWVETTSPYGSVVVAASEYGD
jgi:hypothetical protein